jgi:Protein of unknown function (DUF1460)
MNVSRRRILAMLGSLAVPRFGASNLSAFHANLLSLQRSQAICNRIVEKAVREQWSALPIGERICAIALEFVGTPYVAGTCEGMPEEQYRETCKVDLTGLDCVTFFETSLCMARMLARSKFRGQQKQPTFDDLLAEIVFTRYRGGIVTDYTSRLHYTSEWFHDNEQKGVVRNVTREDKDLRGAERTFFVNAMSAHPNRYPALKASPRLVPTIQAAEQWVNSHQASYIPTSDIRAAQAFMRSGDIVGIVTNKKGLDYSHTGLVYYDKQDNKQDDKRDDKQEKRDKQGLSKGLNQDLPRFLHASQQHKTVMIDRELAQYVAESKGAQGITIVRPLEPH